MGSAAAEISEVTGLSDRLPALVVFHFAWANGIAHRPSSKSRYHAPRIKCALMLGLICVFISLDLRVQQCVLLMRKVTGVVVD